MKTIKKIDICVLFVFFIMAFSATYISSQKIDYDVFIEGKNTWFQADTSRVYDNMTERWSNHSRTNVHPLFTITTNPIVQIIDKIIGDKKTTVQFIISFISACSLALIYLIFRLLEIRIIDSALFTSLAAVSSSSIFWANVPETFMLGTLSMLIVTAFMVMTKNKSFNPKYYVLIGSISLIGTVTNWMAGILISLLNFKINKAIRVCFDMILVVTILSAVQNLIYPSSNFFLFLGGEEKWMMVEASGGWLDKLRIFFFHTLVMPDIIIKENPWSPEWPLFSIQISELGGFLELHGILNLIWLSLFSLGAYTLISSNEEIKLKIYLFSIVLCQAFLHLIYGDETFLYSLHWTPFLIIIASIASKSKFISPVRLMTIALIVGAYTNNIEQLSIILNLINER